jgi:hypothetical protein
MSKKLWKEFDALARQEFAAVGYRRWWDGYVYTCEINDETWGLAAIGKADGWGQLPEMTIKFSVGVRNHAIECALAEIMDPIGGEGRVKSSPDQSTIIHGLNCLLPDDVGPDDPFKRWTLFEGADNAPAVREMVEVVNSYGRRFMEAHASLPAVAAALMGGYQYVDRGQASYRRPIAQMLLGNPELAWRLIEEHLEWVEQRHRERPGMVRDTEYEAFVSEMRQRLGLPS